MRVVWGSGLTLFCSASLLAQSAVSPELAPSSAAYAAPTVYVSSKIWPWVALAALTDRTSAIWFCSSVVATASKADQPSAETPAEPTAQIDQQASKKGCVLPVVDPPAAGANIINQPLPAALPPAESPLALPLLPLLLGAGAAAGAGALALGSGKNNNEPNSPS